MYIKKKISNVKQTSDLRFSYYNVFGTAERKQFCHRYNYAILFARVRNNYARSKYGEVMSLPDQFCNYLLFCWSKHFARRKSLPAGVYKFYLSLAIDIDLQFAQHFNDTMIVRFSRVLYRVLVKARWLCGRFVGVKLMFRVQILERDENFNVPPMTVCIFNGKFCA